jgi:stress responsive alpha/beta barrel protein
MVRHVFLWNVDPGAGPDAGQRIVAALERIKDAPVAARAWSLGADTPPAGSEDSGGRWQYGLVCDYESWDELQAYYSTPEHAAVVEEIVPMIADRAACDFEL